MKEKIQSVPEMKPSLHLSDKQFPAIKGHKVGGKYKVTATLHMTNKDYSKEGVSGSFDLHDIEDKDFKDKSYKDLVNEAKDEGETVTEEEKEYNERQNDKNV